MIERMNFAATDSQPRKFDSRNSTGSLFHPFSPALSPETPSLPDASPSSDRPRCGGRESKPRAGMPFMGRSFFRPTFVALTAVVFLFASVTMAGAKPPRWEYLVISAALKNQPLQQMLNNQGAQGWELVAFTPNSVAVFKRVKAK